MKPIEKCIQKNTIKGHYRWRLYSQDRAMDVGLDDVGIGVLFGPLRLEI